MLATVGADPIGGSNHILPQQGTGCAVPAAATQTSAKARKKANAKIQMAYSKVLGNIVRIRTRLNQVKARNPNHPAVKKLAAALQKARNTAAVMRSRYSGLAGLYGDEGGLGAVDFKNPTTIVLGLVAIGALYMAMSGGGSPRRKTVTTSY